MQAPSIGGWCTIRFPHMRVDVQDLRRRLVRILGAISFCPHGYRCPLRQGRAVEQDPALQGGGNMIKDVTSNHTQYQDTPGRFEAGTGRYRRRSRAWRRHRLRD